ncbi:hypothetical protein [Sporisorium scitamineum]|uniref:Uncharacterized protein n=1 Tax=Sporisorium scitamineum TaxID=49012 RepID=A0A0F7S6A1_9BASI|nr:hypothetical protein [Sporisorium scitamineum]
MSQFHQKRGSYSSDPGGAEARQRAAPSRHETGNLKATAPKN